MIMEPSFRSAWHCVPLPPLGLFPQNETKESPQGLDELFISQIERAYGSNPGWFHLFWLASIT